MFALRQLRSTANRSSCLQVLSRCASSKWESPSDSNGQPEHQPQWIVTGESNSETKRITKLVPPKSIVGDKPKKNEARLLVSGPDATGIVASFSQLLYGHGCGIVDCTSESSEQDDGDRKEHSLVGDLFLLGSGKASCVDNLQHHGRMFFQRILFDYSNINVERSVVEEEIESTCRKFGMESQLSWGDKRRKMAIFVSKYDHCLWELLLRHRAGELLCDVVLIISNHENLRPVAETFDIPYQFIPITKETKFDQEQRQMELLHEQNIDLLVLARYMQVLTPTFCNSFHNRIINIHHSFLPAFTGGMPYHRAHERGVKLIGATAHYATMDLDEGPIIEQDIMRVSHRDDLKDLIRKGRTLEKNVLVSAVKAHLEDRIIVHRNKCIVFAE